MNVTFIGAGEIGSALGRQVTACGHKVIFWDKDPARVPNQKPLAEILPKADAVFFCIPSWTMRGALMETKEFIPKKAVVVCLAKGIEKDTGKLMPELLTELLPEGQSFALLAGPMLAEELDLGIGGVAVVATATARGFKRVQKLFAANHVRCEWTKHVQLTSLLSVLKNVYTVGLGVVDGLEWGFNRKGWYVSVALREMDEIIRMLQKKRGVVTQSAGLGDFVATAFSPYSKNREYGHKLVQTGECDLRSEGCISLPSLRAQLGAHADALPLFLSIYRIVYEKQDARISFETLFAGA